MRIYLPGNALKNCWPSRGFTCLITYISIKSYITHKMQVDPSTVLGSKQLTLAGLLVLSLRTSVLKHSDNACQNTYVLFPNIQCF